MNVRKIATLCGVSRTTVSLALRDNERISTAVRLKIQRIARELGYVPNPKVSHVLAGVARRNGQGPATPLALVSPWPHRREWEHNAMLNQFYLGIQARVAETGYRLEEFWLGEPGMSETRMFDVLRARGIEGAVIFNYVTAPAKVSWYDMGLACVVLGRAVSSPQIPSVDHDHFQGINLALKKIAEQGYVRPGLILMKEGQPAERTRSQWEAGYQLHQFKVSSKLRVPLLLTSRSDGAGIARWMDKYRPDCIIGPTPHAIKLLEGNGFRVPKDVGFVALAGLPGEKPCAGIDIQAEQIGALAVEMVVAQIRAETRRPLYRGGTLLVNGVWREGTTLQ